MVHPFGRHARRLGSASVFFGTLAVATSAVGGQRPADPGRAAGSVAEVVARDGAGAALRSGPGFFVDIGRFVVPRRVLDGARQAGVVVGGREQRVSAVLAEDRGVGLVLLAVDLPDGAPPALHVSPSPPAQSGRVLEATVIDGNGPARKVEVAPALDVPGLGLVHPVVADAGPIRPGGAVVDGEGSLVGALVQHDLGGRHLAFVVPASRLASMEPAGPLPLLEWALSRPAGRSSEGDRAFLEGANAALGRHDGDAVAAFVRAATLDPGNADAWAAAAECERRRKRSDAAVAAWRSAVAARPESPRFHHELGVELSDAGRWQDAALEFAEVVRLRPADAAARFNLGAAYGELRRYGDEYSAYQETLRLDPHHLGALKNLGLACLSLKRYDEAVAAFTRAERVAPADPEVHTGLGLSYFDLKNYQAAIAALKRAVQIAPTLVKAHFGLGAVYAASGDRGAAQAECQAVRVLDSRRGEQLCRIVEGR